jgi:hypothetical protein
VFTNYYDADGHNVPKDSPAALFWVQTEVDCDLVHDTFTVSHLWSVVCVLESAGWHWGERRFGEFRRWEPAQYFIGQILAKGKRRQTRRERRPSPRAVASQRPL